MEVNDNNCLLPNSHHACGSVKCYSSRMILRKMDGGASKRESSFQDAKRDKEERDCDKVEEHGHRDQHGSKKNKSLQIHALKQMLKFIQIDEADTKELQRGTSELAQCLKYLNGEKNTDDDRFQSFSDENDRVKKLIDSCKSIYCVCDQFVHEHYISVDSSFLTKVRFVMGDNFMADFGIIFDDDNADEEKVFIKKELITNALDRLLSERIEFIRELDKLYELAEDSLFHKQFTRFPV
mmetsp:Transcript_1803/g.3257  ORF Transcript_1803/g.3257 Transcript_1803/m.3257 type:complete len:238 (-) Transcript_1803:1481-2194(-)